MEDFVHELLAVINKPDVNVMSSSCESFLGLGASAEVEILQKMQETSLHAPRGFQFPTGREVASVELGL